MKRWDQIKRIVCAFYHDKYDEFFLFCMGHTANFITESDRIEDRQKETEREGEGEKDREWTMRKNRKLRLKTKSIEMKRSTRWCESKGEQNDTKSRIIYEKKKNLHWKSVADMFVFVMRAFKTCIALSSATDLKYWILWIQCVLFVLFYWDCSSPCRQTQISIFGFFVFNSLDIRSQYHFCVLAYPSRMHFNFRYSFLFARRLRYTDIAIICAANA